MIWTFWVPWGREQEGEYQPSDPSVSHRPRPVGGGHPSTSRCPLAPPRVNLDRDHSAQPGAPTRSNPTISLPSPSTQKGPRKETQKAHILALNYDSTPNVVAFLAILLSLSTNIHCPNNFLTAQNWLPPRLARDGIYFSLLKICFWVWLPHLPAQCHIIIIIIIFVCLGVQIQFLSTKDERSVIYWDFSISTLSDAANIYIYIYIN